MVGGVVGGEVAAVFLARALVAARGKEPSRNDLYNLTGSFGGWRRCSLVTDTCGYP